jgi:Tfp pilus assembly protein PilO
MKNLPKEKRDRLILVCLGTVAILAGLYYGLISFQQRSLQEMARRHAEQEIKLNNAQRLAGNGPQIRQNLEAAVTKLKAIEATMPAGDMYSWIIQTVNAFKERYQVDIPSFSREVPSEVGMFAKFPYRAAIFNLRGTAHFHELGRFIADFENTFPYMRVQNLELDPAAASNATIQGDQEKLAFKMEIVTLVNPTIN